MTNDNLNIEEVLSYIDPSCDYQTWIKVAMGLKDEGFSFDVFRDWSAKSEKYDEMYCEYQWNALKKDGTTIGTVIWLAQQNGYVNSNSQYYDEDGKKYISRLEVTGDYSGTIYIDEVDSSLIVKDTGWLKEEEFFEPQDYEWKPVNDLITYLEAVFDPTDIVAYTITSRENNKGKLAPYGKGIYSRTAQNIIDDLKKYNSVEMALGTYNKNAGAWIRINPFDSNGIDDANVVSYKHVLVESDEIEISKQIAIMKALKLPISAMVYSGKKSVHAVVKVDARSKKEYTERVNFIFETCNKNGLKTDTANKNESRLSRMPGVVRDNHKQFLIDTDLGFQSYEAWKEWIDDETDNLPDPVEMCDIWDDLPPRKPELIEGILRETHIMNLSGASKTGKTYLMQELALAIATGDDWLGHKCTQGEVLYIDAEVDKSSSLNNINEVAREKGYTKEMIGKNLIIWNIRGYATQIQNLLPSITRRFKKSNLKLIIIDPMYKINEGDENSAKDMSIFTRGLDKLSVELNCAIAYVHHFAKGSQSEKDSIDRASGSGVIGRHGDALLTVSRLNAVNKEDDSMIALRLEGTIREFAPLEPINMWFKHPIHVLDTEGKLEYAKIGSGNVKKSATEMKAEWMEIAFANCDKVYNEEKKRWEVKQPDLIEQMRIISKSTQDYDNYRSNFDRTVYNKLLDEDLITIFKEENKNNFEAAIFYKNDPNKSLIFQSNLS